MKSTGCSMVHTPQQYQTGESKALKSLSELPAGSIGFVRQMRGGREFNSRMVSLGFTVGVEVVVIQNYGRGPMTVEVRDTRVALGRGEAIKILVEAL